MIEVELTEFIQSGEFGPVRLGMTESEVIACLRSPGEDNSDPEFGASRRFGCMCVNFPDGRANCINVFLNDVFPYVADLVTLRTDRHSWKNMTKMEVWTILSRIDPALVPKRDIVRGLRRNFFVRLGRHTSLHFVRREDEYYLEAISAFDDSPPP